MIVVDSPRASLLVSAPQLVSEMDGLMLSFQIIAASLHPAYEEVAAESLNVFRSNWRDWLLEVAQEQPRGGWRVFSASEAEHRRHVFRLKMRSSVLGASPARLVELPDRSILIRAAAVQTSTEGFSAILDVFFDSDAVHRRVKVIAESEIEASFAASLVASTLTEVPGN